MADKDYCSECSRDLDPDEMDACDKCGDPYCTDCRNLLSACSSCEAHVCPECRTECADCGLSYCKECSGKELARKNEEGEKVCKECAG